ncbi:hypothetical protein D3C85_1772190 [compost metagenome]
MKIMSGRGAPAQLVSNPTMAAGRPTLKALLLSDFARTEHLTPDRAATQLPTLYSLNPFTPALP